jgi:hypothetical protein
MSTASVKEEAKRIVDQFPDSVTWREIAYEFYVRERIEAGLKASMDRPKKTLDEVFAKYGIGDAS